MIGSLLYIPVFVSVFALKWLCWVVLNGWWAILLLYLYTLFKHYKK